MESTVVHNYYDLYSFIYVDAHRAVPMGRGRSEGILNPLIFPKT